MLANSERYTSGAKSAWKADFHPDVTRSETGSGENGDWMRKMEIGGGKRGPEGLQRVSEAAGRPAGGAQAGGWQPRRLAFPVEADVGVLWGDAVGEGWELHVVAVVLAKHFVVAGPAFELAAFKFEGRDSEKAFVFPIFILGSAAKH